MTERLNIRRMQVPETREKDSKIDPQKELRESDWPLIEERLDMERKAGIWTQVALIEAYLKVLAPDKDVSKPDDWANIKKQWEEQWKQLRDTSGSVRQGEESLLFAMKILQPDAVHLTIEQKAILGKSTDSLHESAYLHAVLDKKRIADYERGQIKHMTSKLEANFEKVQFLHASFYARLMGERVDVPQQIWDYTQSQIHNKRGDVDLILSYLAFIFEGYVLSADEVRHTEEKGLELVFRQRENKLPGEPATLEML
jgi:hypothetical protein